MTTNSSNLRSSPTQEAEHRRARFLSGNRNAVWRRAVKATGWKDSGVWRWTQAHIQQYGRDHRHWVQEWRKTDVWWRFVVPTMKRRTGGDHPNVSCNCVCERERKGFQWNFTTYYIDILHFYTLIDRTPIARLYVHTRTIYCFENNR